MSGQGSAGNVVAAIASFFINGLGQLVQGRLGAAIGFFVFGCLCWAVSIVLMGLPVWLLASIVAALDAAKYQPKRY